MDISLGGLGRGVAQLLHLRQVQAPEVKPVGEAPGKAGLLLHPFVVKNNPAAPPPPSAPGQLKVLSFNVRLGGVDYVRVAKTVTEAKADVVCLQEVSRENAEKLAKSLGMHLTFYQSIRHNNSFDNGKAILSKFPFQQAESKPHKLSIMDRLRGMVDKIRHGEGSLWERVTGSVSLWQKRSILRATMKIGGKTVDVIDVHLTTGSPGNTAKQYAELEKYVKARKALGHEVILAGDFNTRMDQAPGNAPDLRGWAKINGQLTDAYGAGDVTIKAVDGRVMTPAQARAALQQPNLSPRQREILTRVANGNTSMHGTGRIDAILTSDAFKPRDVYIDQHNAASDHEPLLATFDVRT